MKFRSVWARCLLLLSAVLVGGTIGCGKPSAPVATAVSETSRAAAGAPLRLGVIARGDVLDSGSRWRISGHAFIWPTSNPSAPPSGPWWVNKVGSNVGFFGSSETLKFDEDGAHLTARGTYGTEPATLTIHLAKNPDRTHLSLELGSGTLTPVTEATPLASGFISIFQ